MDRVTGMGRKFSGLGGKALIIVAVIVVGFVWLGFRSVDAGHIGIVKTGGSVSGIEDPGYAHIWFPFQSFEQIDLRTQKQQFAEIDASSKELQTVKLTGTITYHIEKEHAVDLYTRVGVDDLEEKLIQPALQDYVKEATPQYEATEVLAHRGDIRSHALTALNEKLNSHYRGLIVDDIFISNIGYSPAYEAAVEAKQVAAQQVLQAQQQQEKATIEAKTAIITAQGEAQANAAKTASITPELVNYIAANRWDGHLPTTFAGSGSPLGIFTGSKQ